MRGKLTHFLIEAQAHRNIPAYAGKTKFEEVDERAQPEHPRVCGENKPSTPPMALW